MIHRMVSPIKLHHCFCIGGIKTLIIPIGFKHTHVPAHAIMRMHMHTHLHVVLLRLQLLTWMPAQSVYEGKNGKRVRHVFDFL